MIVSERWVGAVRYGLPGLALGLALAGWSGARGPTAQAQSPGATGDTRGIIAFTSNTSNPNTGSPWQLLYLIDTRTQAFAVYRVDPTNPQARGRSSSRPPDNTEYDLKLSEFNNQPPEVAAIESMVRRGSHGSAVPESDGWASACFGAAVPPPDPAPTNPVESNRTAGRRRPGRPDSIARSTSMAQFYTLEEAARVLGMSPEDLKQKAQHREVRAFMDSGSWQFRVADIDELARRRGLGSDPELSLSDLDLDVPDASGSGEIDLSEFQIGTARPTSAAGPATPDSAAPARTTTRTSCSTTCRCPPGPLSDSSSTIIGMQPGGKRPSDSDVRLVPD